MMLKGIKRIGGSMRWLAIIVVLFVFLAEVIWYEARDEYLVSALLSVGTLRQKTNDGSINRPVENPNLVEEFVYKEIFDKNEALRDHCTAQAKNLQDSPLLRIVCGADTSQAAMDQLSQISTAVIERHQRLFDFESRTALIITRQKRDHLARLQSRINAIPKMNDKIDSVGPNTAMKDSLLFLWMDKRMMLEEEYATLADAIENDALLRSFNRNSLLMEESVKMVRRTMSWPLLFASALIALIMGGLVLLAGVMGVALRETGN